MKEFVRTGRKTLAVFMAVLMAFTALVIAAPQEANAACDHDFSGAETVVDAATCEKDGLKKVKCLNCDETQNVVIPKLGHDYVAGQLVAPTCTTSGYTVMTCKNSATEGVTCEHPSYNLYDETKPATGHAWKEWVVTEESTNTAAGTMERTCAVDGCFAKETAEIPMGGHDFTGATPEVVEAATCKKNGLVKYTCTAHDNCGVSITVSSEKLAHTLFTEVESADCKKEGHIKIYCKVCEEVIYNQVLNVKEHSWGAWTTVKEPTCDQEKGQGKQVRICKNCGDSDEREIAPLATHDLVQTVVAPTCTERGYTIFSCKGCGMVYRDLFVPALEHEYDDGVYEAATCTTPGRVKYTCHRTDEHGNECGHYYYVEYEDEPALGHDLSDWSFVEHPSVNDAYAKWCYCQRTGCTYSIYESGAGEDHQAADGVNIYYQVNYFNEWVTDTYDVLTQNKLYSGLDISYTKLAKTYKTEKLATVYVLKNCGAVYNGATPVREKDVNWGDYTFEGWTLKAGRLPAALVETDENTGAVTNDFLTDGDGKAIIADLSSITKNVDVYAFFRCKEVYYGVTFVNANGRPITIREHILHGHSAEYPTDFGTPTTPENVYYKYEFKGWSYDWAHVYDNVSVFAEYNAIQKRYTLMYYDWDGTFLGSESIAYGEAAQHVPVVKEREEDSTYIYSFLNKWTLENGTEVDLTNFASVSDDTPEGTEIRIFAKHSQRMKLYHVSLTVFDPYSQLLAGGTVQVSDSRGQLVAKVTTDDNGVASFSVNFSTVYTVKITRGNYAIEGTMTLDPQNPGTILLRERVGNVDKEYYGTVTLIDYTNDPDIPAESCSCICHSFLGGFWITLMNLLYRLFGTKHVCCYDMFVVHGDKLNYTSN